MPSSGFSGGGDPRLYPAAAVAAESARCPRCESTNTKFCYYNNYSLAQPRHFCKSCRRYWTLGGSLRNVPPGGSSRSKPPSSSATATTSSVTATTSSVAKRRRPIAAASPPASSATSSSSSSSSPPLSSVTTDPITIAPISASFHVGTTTGEDSADVAGSFAALLADPLPAGFLALGGDPLRGGCCGGGFGLGLGLGLGAGPIGGIDEMGGFGMGRAAWPFYGGEEDGCCGSGDAGGGGERDTWQLGIGGQGDYFGWPELAISTPGWKGLP